MLYSCEFCNTKFKKITSLRAHLGSCRERNLNRVFKKGSELIIVTLNPTRTLLLNLSNAMKINEEGFSIMSVLEYLKRIGKIKDYVIYLPESTIVIKDNFDGLLKITKLMKELTAGDIDELSSNGIRFKVRGKYYECNG